MAESTYTLTILVPNLPGYEPMATDLQYTPKNIKAVLRKALPGWEVRHIGMTSVQLTNDDGDEMDLSVHESINILNKL